MKDSEFLDIIKGVDPHFQEEIATTGFIDTGCYALNAAISGSIFGGVANNRITAFAGESAVGKTYFALTAVRQFLIDNPTGRVVYFDTEFALDREFFRQREINAENVYIVQPETLEDFRGKALKILQSIEAQKEKDRVPLLMVLDSLGNLPSSKELEDSTEGKNTRDMTKQQIIRSIFRTLTQRLGRAGVPLILTNHTYQVVGAYVPTKEVSGGGGVKYAASSTVMISKKKDKDGNDVVGNILTIKMDKSRFTRDSIKVELKLSYQTGLHKYYGLLPIAEELGIFKKVATRYEVPGGKKVYEKEIWRNPEEYFTDEVLAKIDNWCQINYKLGGKPEEEEIVPDADIEEDIEIAGEEIDNDIEGKVVNLDH
ncbi:RecA-like recombination protein [Ochrobactrum phage vB_OspM_OC]|nr:RecA-like recombination protein [Ochrobactrum phage vB_OspM_OC]